MSTQPSAVALAIIAFMTYQLPPAFQLAPATWDDTDDTPTDDGAGCGMALDPAAESERRDVMRQVALDRCAQWALDDADDDLLPWEEELPEYEGADLDDWADGLADVDPMTIRGLLPVVDVDAWHEWALRVEAGDYNAAPVAGAERTGPLTGPVHDGPIALFFDELTLYSGGVWVQMTPSVLDWADAEDAVDPLTIRGLLPVVDVDAWHEWALRVEAGDYNAAPLDRLMLTPDEYFQVLTYIVATAAAALVVACCVAMIVWLWQETQGKD